MNIPADTTGTPGHDPKQDADLFRSYRDEQFWFTAAVVAFNTVVLDKLRHDWPALIASSVISLLGLHIILTRSMRHAKVGPPRNGHLDTWQKRRDYTKKEIIHAWRRLGYVVMECSGSLFYVLLIVVTFLAVLRSFLSESCR